MDEHVTELVTSRKETIEDEITNAAKPDGKGEDILGLLCAFHLQSWCFGCAQTRLSTIQCQSQREG